MVAATQDTARAAVALQREYYLPQAQVLFALAIELALKAAAQITRGSYRAEHDLFQLYEDLPSEAQGRIVDVYAELSRQGLFDDLGVGFEERLQRISTDFVDVRYLFEMVQDEETLVYFEDASLLVDVIWQGLRPTFMTIPRAYPTRTLPEPSGSQFSRTIRIENSFMIDDD